MSSIGFYVGSHPKTRGTEMRVLQLIIVLFVLPTIHGWGKDGHYATCKIAENYLTDEALAAVKALLPGEAEGDLAAVCSWADEVRYKAHYRWSSTLHYADTPDFKCNYNYCRDCHDTVGRKDRCVTGAIYNYTIQLMSEHGVSGLSAVSYNLTEALLFLSHFVGDVHQFLNYLREIHFTRVNRIQEFLKFDIGLKPLHVGFLGDEGGNSITVRWYKRKTNLHHVWDNMIIESALKTFYNKDLSTLIQAIQNNITDAFVDELSRENCNSTACPDPYASESVKAACKFAYRNATPGTTLGDDYFNSRWPVVESRLAKGGVRLAALLNRIFSKQKTIAEQ